MSRLILKQGDKCCIQEADAGLSLLDAIRRAGFDIEAPCGGNGSCGKCLVELKDSAGIRPVHACRTLVGQGGEVNLPADDESVWETLESDMALQRKNGGEFCAAVDLGTTTVAVRAYDAANEALLGETTVWNAQRAYGADVISRVRYCMDEPKGLEILQKTAHEQVFGCLRRLTGNDDAEACCRRMVVAGNTIMQHLWAGIDPSPIAKAPFVPKTFFLEEECKMARLLPCLSGYVGGDIIAGLYALDLDEKSENYLFLDIGTNGEMVLQGPNGRLACSVATGPAFEGAEIACGMAAAPGAVRHCRVQNGRLLLDTVANAPPKGICGSGLVDLLAILLREGVADETGRLLPPDEAPEAWLPWLGEDEDGNGIFYLTKDRTVFFSARDLRKLQLAKAAVAAGIAVLLKESGLAAEQLDAVYLAGSFGGHLDLQNAAAIGLLPGAAIEKVRTVGNSSLAGAEKLLKRPDDWERLLAIRKSCRYLELSGWADFNELYIESMLF